MALREWWEEWHEPLGHGGWDGKVLRGRLGKVNFLLGSMGSQIGLQVGENDVVCFLKEPSSCGEERLEELRRVRPFNS